MTLCADFKSYADANQVGGNFKQVVANLADVSKDAETAIIANADSAVQIQIFGLIVSTFAKGLFTLKSGSDELLVLDIDASRQFALFSSSDEDPLMVCGLGEALSVVNGVDLTGETAFVYIKYKLRAVVS